MPIRRDEAGTLKIESKSEYWKNKESSHMASLTNLSATQFGYLSHLDPTY
jgi:hypothetical protein